MHTNILHLLQDLNILTIELKNYIVFLRCRNSQNDFNFYTIRLHSCVRKPLLGPHLVSVIENDIEYPPFWVQSLTCLKKKFFDSCDTLSFERSAYIQIDGMEGPVPLKDVRLLIELPRFSENESIQIFTAPDVFHEDSVKTSALQSIPRRKTKVHEQLNRCVVHFLTMYHREFGLDMHTAIECLKVQILQSIEKVSSIYTNTIIDHIDLNLDDQMLLVDSPQTEEESKDLNHQELLDWHYNQHLES